MSQNTKWFILFRILFNCRFYYPIYTIFFLDAGLSLSQFATLNLVWALSIVVLEVPSGALADHLGRKKLIVASAVLMVLEMACLAFLPLRAGGFTFWIFVINRILSGAAEACASGADEALTYDSLPEADRESHWKQVQAKLLRWQSACFVLTMLLGAFLYSAGSVNHFLSWIGLGGMAISADTAMKLPVVLCFVSALCCLGVARQFSPAPGELHRQGSQGVAAGVFRWSTVATTVRGIGQAARWIWRSPVTLALLVVGLTGDSFIRLFYTVASQFYRCIEVPTAWNGPIGAILALSGMIYAPILAKMATGLSARQIYGMLALLVLAGFLGMAHTTPLWSLWAAIPFSFAMRALHFSLSSHLNAAIPSEQRATVLSFRGLSMNLAYGILMQSFGWQTLMLAKQESSAASKTSSSDALFSQAMQAWPWVFLAAALLVAVLLGRRLPSLKQDPLLEPVAGIK